MTTNFPPYRRSKFEIGDRVILGPRFVGDKIVHGERFGNVIHTKRDWVHVKFDRGEIERISAFDLSKSAIVK